MRENLLSCGKKLTGLCNFEETRGHQEICHCRNG